MTFSLKGRHWTVILSLIALIGLGIAALVWTRDDSAATKPNTNTRPPVVDTSAVQTARHWAATASGRREQRLARQPLKPSDHAIDLAFASALREASQEHEASTPETRELFDRVKKAEAVVNTDQGQIDQLKKQLAAAPATRQDAIQQHLNLAQAQFELDQDELQDAQEDLMRSGADKQSRIQRQFTRYQATSKNDQDPNAAQNNPPKQDPADASFLGQFTILQQLRLKAVQLRTANQAAADTGNKLKQQHDQLEQQLQLQETTKQLLKQQANNQLQSDSSSDSANSTITSLHQFADKQKTLSDLDRQIQDYQELADTYASWGALVQSSQKSAIHRILTSIIWIILIVLIVYIACRVIDHFLIDLTQERKTLRTLRVIMRFAVQAIGILVGIFVLFGIPSQMSTILGLAGAGLTVALKDFIVGFFGWFVLMGKNGIRVGDWVEINGIVGEVIDVGLLRTVLLETGNWAEAGHPTGRRVTFVNSFAIEGHYFNFSTTGQWLWDTLELMVPAEDDPYAISESILQVIQQETEEDAHNAEKEWHRATHNSGVHSFSAAPSLNMRPTMTGTNVIVRYITHANERFTTRNRIYAAVVGLLHRRHSPTIVQTKENAAP